jgi:hypothetical protein
MGTDKLSASRRELLDEQISKPFASATDFHLKSFNMPCGSITGLIYVIGILKTYWLRGAFSKDK